MLGLGCCDSKLLLKDLIDRMFKKCGVVVKVHTPRVASTFIVVFPLSFFSFPGGVTKNVYTLHHLGFSPETSQKTFFIYTPEN